MIRLTVLLFLVLQAIGAAEIIHVPGDHVTIQGAIDSAADGDTVLVAPGTYMENIDFSGKAIHLTSSHGPETTIIDGGSPVDPDRGCVVFFAGNETADSRLEGFTITNGTGLFYEHSHVSWWRLGGGIYCRAASPTITGNIITGNSVTGLTTHGSSGGGIYCVDDASPVITDNTIAGNFADDHGGGICAVTGSPEITSNRIRNNKACSGGGIDLESVTSTTVAHNTITLNRAEEVNPYDSCMGGGIHCWKCSLSVTDNLIEGNFADHSGGGLCDSSSELLVTHNTFRRNYAINGAGIYCNHASIYNENVVTGNKAFGVPGARAGGVYLTDCIAVFSKNIVTFNSSNYGGGIMCAYSGEVPEVVNNWIYGNTANRSGGGIYSLGSPAIIMGNMVLENTCSFGGGGIVFDSMSEATVTGNMIIGNSSDDVGGGVCCFHFSEPTLANNTIVDNHARNNGGGIYLRRSHMTVVNSILWNNNARHGDEIWMGESYESSAMIISHTNVNDDPESIYIDWSSVLHWGDGMIDADPLFVDHGNGDLHLTYDSPCRDAGDNAHAIDAVDFEGDPRVPWIGTIDMGADEFYTHLYTTGDAVPGGAITGMLIGIPGTLPVGLFFGSSVLEEAWHHPWGDFWMTEPWFVVSLPPIPASGVLEIPVTIPRDPPPPWDLPMQGLVGLESDSFTNLCVLEVR